MVSTDLIRTDGRFTNRALDVLARRYRIRAGGRFNDIAVESKRGLNGVRTLSGLINYNRGHKLSSNRVRT